MRFVNMKQQKVCFPKKKKKNWDNRKSFPFRWFLFSAEHVPHEHALNFEFNSHFWIIIHWSVLLCISLPLGWTCDCLFHARDCGMIGLDRKRWAPHGVSRLHRQKPHASMGLFLSLFFFSSMEISIWWFWLLLCFIYVFNCCINVCP